MAAAYTTKSAEEENLWNCACCATFWKFPRGKLHQGAYSTTIQPNSYKRMTYGEIYDILRECM